LIYRWTLPKIARYRRSRQGLQGLWACKGSGPARALGLQGLWACKGSGPARALGLQGMQAAPDQGAHSPSIRTPSVMAMFASLLPV